VPRSLIRAVSPIIVPALVFPSRVIAAVAFGVLAAAVPARAQQVQGFAAAALAGESIALVPLTLAVAEPALATDTAFAALRGRRVLAWADSTIAEAFQDRAPEVKWILPPQLRRLARRNPGMVPDPDHMGQAVMRSPKLKRVPDPLRSSLRALVAFTGSRYAMVPAALVWTRDTTGALKADLSLALADTRSGSVPWRTETSGTGRTPAEALTAALNVVLPVDTSGQ
jgi:hypothetical protein